MIELNQIYTYENIMAEMEQILQTYPDVLSMVEAGVSHDGRRIAGLLLGESEECLIVTAGMHGRESVNPILLLCILSAYCRQMQIEYKLGKDKMNHIFSKYSILFIPLVNPDGYEIALQGFDVIRNPVLRESSKAKEIPYEEWKYNARGIDINRNFPCHSYTPQGEMTDAASEHETVALIQLFKKYPNSVGYIDFHSRGKIIYYYRNAMSFSYNRKGKAMARKLQTVSGYARGKRASESFTSLDGGNSVNYYSEYFGKLAITVETVSEAATFPLDIKYYKPTYREIKNIPLEFLRQL